MPELHGLNPQWLDCQRDVPTLPAPTKCVPAISKHLPKWSFISAQEESNTHMHTSVSAYPVMSGFKSQLYLSLDFVN